MSYSRTLLLFKQQNRTNKKCASYSTPTIHLFIFHQVYKLSLRNLKLLSHIQPQLIILRFEDTYSCNNWYANFSFQLHWNVTQNLCLYNLGLCPISSPQWWFFRSFCWLVFLHCKRVSIIYIKKSKLLCTKFLNFVLKMARRIKVSTFQRVRRVG